MPTQKEKYKSSGMFGAIFSYYLFFFFFGMYDTHPLFQSNYFTSSLNALIKEKLFTKERIEQEKKNDPLISSKLLLPQALGASPALIF